jgi:phenylpyruvate tautomerase PptA (4-oxalocrotonate tautomerase family)
MPVLDVELVLRDGEVVPGDLASHIADAAGKVLDAAPGTSWVRLRTLPSTCYAESGGGPPPGTRPAFVRVLVADLPEGAMLVDEAERLTDAIAAVLSRPRENVHLVYESPARGRVAFGGKLIV